MSEKRDVTHSDPVEQLGFTQIPNAVLLNGNLSPEARILYGVLKSYAWFDRDDAWPGKQRIAQQVGINPKNVLRYQNELIDAKLITVERRGLGRTNRYIVHPPTKTMARRVRALEEEARRCRDEDLRRKRVKRGVDPEAPVRAQAPDQYRAPAPGHVRLPAPDKAYEGETDEARSASNGNGAPLTLADTSPSAPEGTSSQAVTPGARAVVCRQSGCGASPEVADGGDGVRCRDHELY